MKFGEEWRQMNQLKKFLSCLISLRLPNNNTNQIQSSLPNGKIDFDLICCGLGRPLRIENEKEMKFLLIEQWSKESSPPIINQQTNSTLAPSFAALNGCWSWWAAVIDEISLALVVFFLCGLWAGPPANAPQRERRQQQTKQEEWNQLEQKGLIVSELSAMEWKQTLFLFL